jgi:hypothetical protein
MPVAAAGVLKSVLGVDPVAHGIMDESRSGGMRPSVGAAGPGWGIAPKPSLLWIRCDTTVLPCEAWDTIP